MICRGGPRVGGGPALAEVAGLLLVEVDHAAAVAGAGGGGLGDAYVGEGGTAYDRDGDCEHGDAGCHRVTPQDCTASNAREGDASPMCRIFRRSTSASTGQGQDDFLCGHSPTMSDGRSGLTTF